MPVRAPEKAAPDAEIRAPAGASTGRSPAVNDTLPTYRAVLTIPAGIDETRLAVVDDTSVIAEHV